MKYCDNQVMTIAEVIQWIFQSHATGIDFIEWGAPSIDISFIVLLYMNRDERL